MVPINRIARITRIPLRARHYSPSDEEMHSNTGPPTIEPEPFYPNILEVLRVRHLLRWKVIPHGLPTEIVDLIIDAAEYWPSTVTSMEKETVIRQDRDQELVRTLPLCFDEKSLQSSPPKPLPHRTAHPCRKILFSISAKDQGGGIDVHNKYRQSYTWFDTNVIHNNHEAGENATQTDPPSGKRHFGPDDPLLLPRANKLQNNPRRTSEYESNIIVWHCQDNIAADSAEAEEIEETFGRGRATLDGSTVRALQVGDSISVVGRARFPGWQNKVQRVSVRVFWSV